MNTGMQQREGWNMNGQPGTSERDDRNQERWPWSQGYRGSVENYRYVPRNMNQGN